MSISCVDSFDFSMFILKRLAHQGFIAGKRYQYSPPKEVVNKLNRGINNPAFTFENQVASIYL